jgi:hypothetical protein
MYVRVHLARNRPAGAPRAHRIRSTSKRKMRGKYQNCTSWLAVGGRRLQASDSAEKRRTSLDRNVAGKRGRRAGNAAVMSCGRVGLSRVRRACVDVACVILLRACMHGAGRVHQLQAHVGLIDVVQCAANSLSALFGCSMN